MALSQIPNPYGIEWQTWVDTFVGFNPSIRDSVSPDLPWGEFAERLTQVEPGAPRPDFFREWREWAAFLKLAYPD